MIQPRNTFVVVKLLEKSESKIGAISVPTASEQYCEAQVVAVGPGTVQAAGGISETHDLQPGQRVWIRHKEPRQNPQAVNGVSLELIGVPYRIGNETFHVFQEARILAILDEAPVLDGPLN